MDVNKKNVKKWQSTPERVHYVDDNDGDYDDDYDQRLISSCC